MQQKEISPPESSSESRDIATLGGGCFWCLDPLYKDLIGVEDVVVGYAGGKWENPTYEQVCSGSTGHAEVVQVIFNPQVISFEQILQVFFTVHDPTTLNRQGNDVGSQYRSIILYHSQKQHETAERVIREVESATLWDNPIVTEVVPFQSFYPAQDYHQDYYLKNPHQGYCQVVISPKIAKFRKQYANRLKSLPDNFKAKF